MLTRILLPLLFFSYLTSVADAIGAKIKLSSWPDADALFHQDPRFRGGDGAHSIDLGHGRILWLMGDSFIADKNHLKRENSIMIRNCVAIQSGYNPAEATIRFTWGYEGRKPASFFSESGEQWFWPGHGTLIGDRLLVFLMRIGSVKSILGFESVGWNAILIANPKQRPRFWNLSMLNGPQNPWNILLGSASVFIQGDFLYAYSAEDSGSRGVYLVRFDKQKAYQGDLSEPYWWDAHQGKWFSQAALLGKPRPLFKNGSTEFTVHYSSMNQKWIQFQVEGFGGSPIVARTAMTMTGPWQESPLRFYPSEATTPGVLIYAAKAHPELDGAGKLVLTYASNLLDFQALLRDERFYYPRFLTMDLD